MTSRRTGKYSRDQKSKLTTFGYVEIGCGDMQLSFDELLRESNMIRDRDYTRKEINVSHKKNRPHIIGYVYTLI